MKRNSRLPRIVRRIAAVAEVARLWELLIHPKSGDFGYPTSHQRLRGKVVHPTLE